MSQLTYQLTSQATKVTTECGQVINSGLANTYQFDGTNIMLFLRISMPRAHSEIITEAEVDDLGFCNSQNYHPFPISF